MKNQTTKARLNQKTEWTALTTTSKLYCFVLCFTICEILISQALTISHAFFCSPRFFSFPHENDEDIAADDWVPPNADPIRKMVSQIEHYLSDENSAKDAFLLKHVRRNKMGYVNIKLLTSFKKVR